MRSTPSSNPSLVSPSPSAESPGAAVSASIRAGGRAVWLAGALIVASLLSAGLAHRVLAQNQQARFDYEVRRVEDAVRQRMLAYVQILRGGLGLFAASDEVTRADWAEYVAALKIEERFPGIRQMSFVPAVPEAEVAALIARVRAEPLPPDLTDPKMLRDFTLRPPPPPIEPVASELHGPVLYTAPLTPVNERSLGLDMMLDASRRASMLQAVEQGDAVLSARLSLLQRGGTQVGFIAYLPLYRGERWLGWLTAVFYAEDFMRGLLGADGPALDFEVFDGEAGRPDALLYSTAGVEGGLPVALPAAEARFQLTRAIPVPGREWTLRYRARPDFVSWLEHLVPALFAFAGFLAALLVYATDRARGAWRLQAEVLRIKEAEVRHQATHDPLTGLANRTLFMDRLATAIERADRRSQPFALAYLDIDGFKPVNDEHGHQVGDALLREIARRLQTVLRREDTVARLGGDEFALILEVSGTALRLCSEVVASLREPFDLGLADGSVRVQVGASAGVAIYPEHGRDSDRLIAAADAAMYRAKREGRNRCLPATSSSEIA